MTLEEKNKNDQHSTKERYHLYNYLIGQLNTSPFPRMCNFVDLNMGARSPGKRGTKYRDNKQYLSMIESRKVVLTAIGKSD